MAELVDASRKTLIAWRDRYLERGLAGVSDRDRPGRPRELDQDAIIVATLTPPSKDLGVMHWSTRMLTARIKVSPAAVARAWRPKGLNRSRPSRSGSPPTRSWSGRSLTSAGAILNPLENAIVFRVGTRSQIQALDRTVPIPPTQPGKVERRSHDYYRHGATTTLFAALEVATGKVTAALRPRHRLQEFLAFLRQIERAYREVVDDAGKPVELHLVMDSYAAHERAEVKAWLARHPRIIVHFTPTHASLMNLVEASFGIVERSAAACSPPSRTLGTKIPAFIDGWNPRAHPFVWTKTAEQIPGKANRPTTPNPHR
ncbi:hypothetical protein HNP11_004225 [Tsukamurella ocularis]|nr:hypothetical protein [Tsukamurella ocularis]